jgi:hypothetical protein
VSDRLNRSMATPRNAIALVVAEVALFLIANVLYHHGSVLQAISSVAWVAFLLGLLLLIGLGIVALLQSFNPRSPAGTDRR